VPWTQHSALEMRTRFIADALNGRYRSHTELCRHYNVSRKTGYKWLKRYEELEWPGLLDRSHRPQACPHETPDDVVLGLLEVRRKHPTWGAKKLLKVLGTRHPDWELPARSTAHDILRRNGLVERKRRRPRFGHPGRSRTTADHPNDLWTADFKGQFRMKNGVYCYPLTVADSFSRFFLGCDALLSTREADTIQCFKRIFEEHGLPERIRTDNGVPFATYSLARLSRLAVWWMRLGIRRELIEPGKPQQNGAHERMHRTLKAETTRPPENNLRAQQRRFDSFRDTYNHARPHESLDQETPGSLYEPASRTYPDRLPPVEYPGHFEVRKVSANGGVRWKGRYLNLTTVLLREYVGFEEVDDGLWTVYYSTTELGRFDEHTFRITDLQGDEYRKPHQSRHPRPEPEL
jgi:transposase InsO family protein